VRVRLLKEAIVLAAEASKHSKGDGLVGYLTHIADNRPDLFVRLIGKLMQLQGKTEVNPEKEPAKPVVYKSSAEIRATLIERGMPVSKVDMLMGKTPSNVIDGPFKRQDVDDTND
jgi:hypothetical protein